ncbi:MAG TPA: ribosome-associated translation inhibitor RaiA [Actinomycetota bacterium]|jgi:ribosomal subunit interface protein
MDLVLKGRGLRITEQIREITHHKIDKLSRLEPRAVRVEVEIVSEDFPTQDGTKTVDAALQVPRHTFRAHAQGARVEDALDLAVARLERQVRDRHGRVRSRLIAGASRFKSTRTEDT